MNLKASKSTFKKENMNLNDYVNFWLSWLFIVAFGLNKKVSYVGLLKLFCNIYISIFMKRFSYIMF